MQAHRNDFHIGGRGGSLLDERNFLKMPPTMVGSVAKEISVSFKPFITAKYVRFQDILSL